MLYNTVVVSGQQRALSPKNPKLALISAKTMALLVVKGDQIIS
jgi:hypothetical protein